MWNVEGSGGARLAFKDWSVGLNDASRIWDAVDLGVSALESEAGRRAIVLLTDGEASGNRLGVADVIRHARASNVAVSVIGSGGWVLSMDLPTRGPTPRSALEALTSETGDICACCSRQRHR